MSSTVLSRLTHLELVEEPLEESPELGYRWLQRPSHLNVVKSLSSGVFGTAVIVTRDDFKGPDGRKDLFVAKLFPKRHPYNTKENVVREVRTIRKVKSAHIVRCFVLYENRDYFVAIFEPAKGGDLFQRLNWRKRYGQRFNEKEAASIIAQVLDAVACIHREKIIHRDIKTANIFFKYPQEVKNWILLGDFGFSIGTEVEDKGFPRSRLYAAPELLQQEDYGTKVDVWAIGIVAFEILSGEVPFSEAKTNKELNLPPSASSKQAMMSDEFIDARDFISRCLIKSPGKRMSAEEALQHKWIRDNKGPDFKPKEKWNEAVLSENFAKLKTTTSRSVSGRETKGDSKKESTSQTATKGKSVEAGKSSRSKKGWTRTKVRKSRKGDD